MLPPVYKTRHYTLAPYQEEDLIRYLEMTLHPDVIAFMGGATGDIEKEKQMFQKIFDLYAGSHEARWFWVWAVYRDGILCGHLELKETQDTANDELEIVYMIHPAERRRGIMTEVLRYIKEKQSSWNRKITATVYPENYNSIKLLEQVGIEKQKLITDHETKETFYKFWLNTIEEE